MKNVCSVNTWLPSVRPSSHIALRAAENAPAPVADVTSLPCNLAPLPNSHTAATAPQATGHIHITLHKHKAHHGTPGRGAPSIWLNSARCVRSTASLRNTRSMEKRRAGRNPRAASAYSMRVDTAVVCVRSKFFSASASRQGPPYLRGSRV